MFEVIEVEYLQVDANGAGRPIARQLLGHLRRTTGQAGGTKLVGLATDSCGPALDLGLVDATAQHERRRMHHRAGVPPGALAGRVDQAELALDDIKRSEWHVEFVSETCRQSGRPEAAVTTDDDRRSR